MKTFEQWLANSALASVLKIAVAGALSALVTYAATSSWDPLLVVAGTAFLTPLINYLNPQDPRYGKYQAE